MRTPVLAATVAVPGHLLGGVRGALDDVRGAGRVTGSLDLVEATDGQGDPDVQGGIVVVSSELGEPPVKQPKA
jgi:valyl-tRNA synthetase